MAKDKSKKKTEKKVGIVGTGPAGLMAADILASAKVDVTLFEKRPGPSWKLYVAGSSGLNITNDLPIERFASHYSGPPEFWKECLAHFSPEHWLSFIEDRLGLKTFLGTSRRYFVETMHAAKLIKLWRRRLQGLGVVFKFEHECVGFESTQLQFSTQAPESFDAICFALGSASWEKNLIHWPEFFEARGIGFNPFLPANAGYEVNWTPGFLKEAEGLPLKNIKLSTTKGERLGDLVVTSYGLEGTPVYTLGEAGQISLDLKPDLSETAILEKLSRDGDRRKPLRRAQKLLKLSPAIEALLFHMASPTTADLTDFVKLLKNFPLELLKSRPLSETISASGGILWSEVDDTLMLRKAPKVYCIGEMLDWEAPTGGFLIQGCVSQGAWAASRLLSRFAVNEG